MHRRKALPQEERDRRRGRQGNRLMRKWIKKKIGRKNKKA